MERGKQSRPAHLTVFTATDVTRQLRFINIHTSQLHSIPLAPGLEQKIVSITKPKAMKGGKGEIYYD